MTSQRRRKVRRPNCCRRERTHGQAVQGSGTAGASEDGAGNHLSTSPLWIPLSVVLSGSRSAVECPIGSFPVLRKGDEATGAFCNPVRAIRSVLVSQVRTHSRTSSMNSCWRAIAASASGKITCPRSCPIISNRPLQFEASKRRLSSMVLAPR